MSGMGGNESADVAFARTTARTAASSLRAAQVSRLELGLTRVRWRNQWLLANRQISLVGALARPLELLRFAERRETANFAWPTN